jgi:carboxypeptidase family protein/TonB-dependent receptor-like protein
MSRVYQSVLVLLLLAITASASAQSTTGDISGTARDESRAVLPGVTVEVRNLETGATRSIVTDVEGRYRALNLPSGRYTVIGELSGFSKAQVNDIVVQIGRDVTVDLTMTVGQLTESVVVTGEAKLLDLGSAVVGGVVSTKQIAELPLNGRSFMQLATLQPGVSVSRTTERDFTGGFGSTQISIAGARPEQTGYLLEGTNVSDIADKAPSSVAGVMLGVDTVKEFSVQTHGYSAEFGRAAGGIISAVTKSGTNKFSGTAFEFLRDSSFDARGYFDEGNDPPPFTRNQFGGTLGGPIVKNNLFFFGSYEGLRERLATTRLSRLPNAAAHNGLIPDGAGGLRQVAVHPNVKPYLDLLYPLPNGRDFGDGTAEYSFANTEPTNENYLVGKVDWNLDKNNNFSVRVSNDASNNQSWANNHPLFTDRTTTDARYVMAQWQRIFSASLLNEFRAADNRTARELLPSPLVDIPSGLFWVNEPYFGYIEFSGAPITSAGNVDDSAKYAQNLYQVSDTLTWQKGRHTVKAGGDFQRYHFDGFSNSRLGGNYRFRSLEEFLTLRRSATAQADRYTGNLPGTDTDRHMRQSYVSMFVHDDFRVNNSLSLSLGLRYEFVTTPHELDGKVAGLLSLDDLESGPQGITPGAPLFDNPSMAKGLAPRVGLAWTPNTRTTIRGGGGIFYQPLTVSFYRGTTFRLYPYFAGVDIRQPTVFGPGIQDVLASGVGSANVQKRSEFISYETDQPYNVQWYVNSQHQLAGKFVVEIGYMGSRGVDLPYYGDPNTTPSMYLADGTKVIVPGATLRYPSWGRIRTRTTGAWSQYHGMTLGLERKLSNGLQFQGNYTYSRSIDTWSGGLQGSSDFLTGAGSAVDWWDIEFEKGRSSFDVPHNFVFNAVYQLPMNGGLGGIKGALVNGWQVSGIAQLSSGLPFHPIIGFDRAGDRQSDTDMQRPSWAPGFNASNAITGDVNQWFNPQAFVLPAAGTFGNVSRNALRGPNLRTVDFSVFKNQGLFGKLLQLRVEIFNVFDRANFNPPGNPTVFNTDGTYVSGSGRITTLATTPRQIQFGVKYVF